ncbi:MAG TPA: hypothetical protein VNF08_00360 [Acidimicrobiales bacterium]|nr:hypothetical protein [Acidimicrobiales bacterium]
MLALARSTLTVAGRIFVLWLITAEVLIIGYICRWCTGVHVVMTALLLVLTRGTLAERGVSRRRRGMASGHSTAQCTTTRSSAFDFPSSIRFSIVQGGDSATR